MSDKKQNKHFEIAIKKYLDDRAATDALFKPFYEKEGKSIAECCKYIINTVQEMKVEALPDDVVYNMAVHYYQEDKIDVGKDAAKCKIVVAGIQEFTQEEKDKIRAEAKEKLFAEAKEQIRNGGKKHVEEVKAEQESLF